MSAWGWANALIVVGLIFIAFCVVFIFQTRERKPFISDTEANKFRPGCFQIGRDVK